MNLLNSFKEKSKNPFFLISTIFWSLVFSFTLIIGIIFSPNDIRRTLFPLVMIFGIILFLLGIALVFFTLKNKITGKLKKFLLLMGGAAAGFIPGVLLHNLVYGLFILIFGADFWDKTSGGDEPFFFIFAIIICPLVFLIGTIGGAYYLRKNKNKDK